MEKILILSKTFTYLLITSLNTLQIIFIPATECIRCSFLVRIWGSCCTEMFPRSYVSVNAALVGRPLNRLKSPVIFYITVRSKAVLLIWFSVFACFGVSSCTVFTIKLGLGSPVESCSFGLPYFYLNFDLL